MKHIVSFSGGKDSTGMLLKMFDEKMSIDEVVFIDSTVEFPEIYEHIKKVEEYINAKITVLRAKHSFEYYLGSHIKKNGQVGYGFPDIKNRWCTQLLKKNVIKKYFNKYKGEDVIEYHGIAFDEISRSFKNKEKKIRYPLIEFKMTGRDALNYSYERGFDFGGLYKKFFRVSCWCCPFKRIGELRVLYLEYPQLWKKLIEMDSMSRTEFRLDYSLKELEKRFKAESLQYKLF